MIKHVRDSEKLLGEINYDLNEKIKKVGNFQEVYMCLKILKRTKKYLTRILER